MTEIERKRKDKGYTQQFVADGIGVSVSCYNMYENNQRKIPINKAREIAHFLECEINDIFTPFSFTSCERKEDIRRKYEITN